MISVQEFGGFVGKHRVTKDAPKKELNKIFETFLLKDSMSKIKILNSEQSKLTNSSTKHVRESVKSWLVFLPLFTFEKDVVLCQAYFSLIQSHFETLCQNSSKETNEKPNSKSSVQNNPCFKLLTKNFFFLFCVETLAVNSDSKSSNDVKRIFSLVFSSKKSFAKFVMFMKTPFLMFARQILFLDSFCDSEPRSTNDQQTKIRLKINSILGLFLSTGVQRNKALQKLQWLALGGLEKLLQFEFDWIKTKPENKNDPSPFHSAAFFRKYECSVLGEPQFWEDFVRSKNVLLREESLYLMNTTMQNFKNISFYERHREDFVKLSLNVFEDKNPKLKLLGFKTLILFLRNCKVCTEIGYIKTLNEKLFNAMESQEIETLCDLYSFLPRIFNEMLENIGHLIRRKEQKIAFKFCRELLNKRINEKVENFSFAVFGCLKVILSRKYETLDPVAEMIMLYVETVTTFECSIDFTDLSEFLFSSLDLRNENSENGGEFSHFHHKLLTDIRSLVHRKVKELVVSVNSETEDNANTTTVSDLSKKLDILRDLVLCLTFQKTKSKTVFEELKREFAIKFIHDFVNVARENLEVSGHCEASSLCLQTAVEIVNQTTEKSQSLNLLVKDEKDLSERDIAERNLKREVFELFDSNDISTLNDKGIVNSFRIASLFLKSVLSGLFIENFETLTKRPKLLFKVFNIESVEKSIVTELKKKSDIRFFNNFESFIKDFLEIDKGLKYCTEFNIDEVSRFLCALYPFYQDLIGNELCKILSLDNRNITEFYICVALKTLSKMISEKQISVGLPDSVYRNIFRLHKCSNHEIMSLSKSLWEIFNSRISLGETEFINFLFSYSLKLSDDLLNKYAIHWDKKVLNFLNSVNADLVLKLFDMCFFVEDFSNMELEFNNNEKVNYANNASIVINYVFSDNTEIETFLSKFSKNTDLDIVEKEPTHTNLKTFPNLSATIVFMLGFGYFSYFQSEFFSAKFSSERADLQMPLIPRCLKILNQMLKMFPEMIVSIIDSVFSLKGDNNVVSACLSDVCDIVVSLRIPKITFPIMSELTERFTISVKELTRAQNQKKTMTRNSSALEKASRELLVLEHNIANLSSRTDSDSLPGKSETFFNEAQKDHLETMIVEFEKSTEEIFDLDWFSISAICASSSLRLLQKTTDHRGNAVPDYHKASLKILKKTISERVFSGKSLPRSLSCLEVARAYFETRTSTPFQIEHSDSPEERLSKEEMRMILEWVETTTENLLRCIESNKTVKPTLVEKPLDMNAEIQNIFYLTVALGCCKDFAEISGPQRRDKLFPSLLRIYLSKEALLSNFCFSKAPNSYFERLMSDEAVKVDCSEMEREIGRRVFYPLPSIEILCADFLLYRKCCLIKAKKYFEDDSLSDTDNDVNLNEDYDEKQKYAEDFFDKDLLKSLGNPPVSNSCVNIVNIAKFFLCWNLMLDIYLEIDDDHKSAVLSCIDKNSFYSLCEEILEHTLCSPSHEIIEYFERAKSMSLTGLEKGFSSDELRELLRFGRLGKRVSKIKANFCKRYVSLIEYGVLKRKELFCEKLAVRTYLRLLLLVPALVRKWALTFDRYKMSKVSEYTKKYFSPLIIKKEIEETLKNTKYMTIKRDSSNTTLVALYSNGEVKLTLMLSFPPNYPITSIEFKLGKQVNLEKRATKWILQIMQRLNRVNGNVSEAVTVWRENVESYFEGIVDCPICYMIVNENSKALPEKECRVCHSKFHSECIFKWFSKSDKKICPMCRSEFED